MWQPVFKNIFVSSTFDDDDMSRSNKSIEMVSDHFPIDTGSQSAAAGNSMWDARVD